MVNGEQCEGMNRYKCQGYIWKFIYATSDEQFKVTCGERGGIYFDVAELSLLHSPQCNEDMTFQPELPETT